MNENIKSDEIKCHHLANFNVPFYEITIPNDPQELKNALERILGYSYKDRKDLHDCYYWEYRRKLSQNNIKPMT